MDLVKNLRSKTEKFRNSNKELKGSSNESTMSSSELNLDKTMDFDQVIRLDARGKPVPKKNRQKVPVSQLVNKKEKVKFVTKQTSDPHPPIQQENIDLVDSSDVYFEEDGETTTNNQNEEEFNSVIILDDDSLISLPSIDLPQQKEVKKKGFVTKFEKKVSTPEKQPQNNNGNNNNENSASDGTAETGRHRKRKKQFLYDEEGAAIKFKEGEKILFIIYYSFFHILSSYLNFFFACFSFSNKKLVLLIFK